MKTTTFLSALALGATTVSAFPSTQRHGHAHLHSKRQTLAAPYAAPSPPAGGAAAPAAGGYGLAYDLMADDGSCRSWEEIAGNVAQLAQEGYTKIRTYDVGCHVDGLANAIQQHPGMKLFAGINTVNDVAGDLTKLIYMLQPYWAIVDTVNIGNEVVNQGGSPGAVTAAIGTARGMLSSAGYTGQVVTVDTFVAHLAHPELCAASDYCAANIYAYFDGNVAAEGAGDFVRRMSTAVAGIANGKRVVTTESGWPKCGPGNGKAVAGPAQQATAMASIRAAFSGDQSDLFLFQSYDAKYKPPGPGGVEQCWGIH